MDEDARNDIQFLYRCRYLVENIRDVIWEADPNLVITYISPAVREMSGYVPEDMEGRCALDFLSSSSREEISGQWKSKIYERMAELSEDIVFLDVEFMGKDERGIWVEISGKPIYKDRVFIGYLGTARDISEKKTYEKNQARYIKELKNANSRLEEMVNHDLLTGAYSRRLFEYYFKTSVDMKLKYSCAFSIILLNIDNFKQLNDKCGNSMCDELLRKIATILKNTLRESDKLFRWGGDEFIILLSGVVLKDACKVAEKLRCSIETVEFELRGDKVTASLGVGEYVPGESMEQFVSGVDKAMLEAKAFGGNRMECKL